MKKNILKATLVVAFALIAGMNVYNAQQSDVMSDLALANVEALASGESSTTNRYQTMGYCAPLNMKIICVLQDELQKVVEGRADKMRVL